MISNQRSAIIYAHTVLAGSMTFVKSHAEALKSYKPVYAGAHRVKGLELPADRTVIVNDRPILGHLKEFLFREFRFAPGFVEKLRAQNPAIVHVHFGTAGPSGMVLSEKLNVPLIVTFHGRDATMNPDQLRSSRRGRDLLRSRNDLMERTGLFIAVSAFVRDRLLEQGYPESKIVLHRNGIDLEYFQPLTDGSRDPVVLFVGRFTEKKGARYLIEAAARLHKAGVKFELVMLGDGPLKSNLVLAASRAGITCRFPGFLPLEDVRQWIGRATVVVVPSVTASDGDSEGLPTILLEAQAMETPIVATRHSGIPEGIQEGSTGELVSERDVKALADSIGSFLSSPAKVRSYGQSGRQFVAKNFDLRAQVDGLEKMYSDLHERRIQSSPIQRT